MTTYALLKFVHVLSVIIWLGTALTANLLTWRVARTGDREALSLLFRHTSFLGPRLVGPAALVTLLSGLGMVFAGRVDPQALWVQWGFGGIVVHFLFAPIFLRRAGMQLYQAISDGDEQRFAAARRRVGRLGAVYLAILLSVVGAMVMKPTL